MGNISKETREYLIKLHKAGYKPNAILKKLPESIALSSVYFIIKKYKETHSIANRPFKRKRKIDGDMSTFIENMCNGDRYSKCVQIL